MMSAICDEVFMAGCCLLCDEDFMLGCCLLCDEDFMPGCFLLYVMRILCLDVFCCGLLLPSLNGVVTFSAHSLIGGFGNVLQVAVNKYTKMKHCIMKVQVYCVLLTLLTYGFLLPIYPTVLHIVCCN